MSAPGSGPGGDGDEVARLRVLLAEQQALTAAILEGRAPSPAAAEPSPARTAPSPSPPPDSPAASTPGGRDAPSPASWNPGTKPSGLLARIFGGAGAAAHAARTAQAVTTTRAVGVPGAPPRAGAGFVRPLMATASDSSAGSTTPLHVSRLPPSAPQASASARALGGHGAPAPQSDEEFARQLQAEEEAAGTHAIGGGGAWDSAHAGAAVGRGAGGRSAGGTTVVVDGRFAPGGAGASHAVSRRGSGGSGGSGGLSDAELAARLQQQELYTAAQGMAADRQAEEAENAVVDDPVWGRYEGRPGKPFRPHEVLFLSMCPCLLPPLCSRARRAAYRRVGATVVCWASVAQIILLGVSLRWRGFAPMAVNPMFGPWPDTLDLLQAKNAAEIVYNLQLWRLVTPIFLHAGVIHLASNLVMQLRLGLYLEVEWGSLAFAQVYIASGIGASIYSCVFKPDDIGVGASGALMGIMGGWLAHILIYWTEGDERARTQRAFQFIMVVVNISVIIGFSFVPYIDWAAHIFGLISGAMLGAWVFGGHISHPGKRALVRLAGLGSYIALAAGGLAVVFLQLSPTRDLLRFCEDVVQPGYPTAGLTCYSP